MDNKLFFNGFLYALLGAKGNIPDSTSKDIAIKASIGSLLPGGSIAPFIVAEELKKGAEKNLLLNNQVNNSISAAEISGRIQKLYDNATAKPNPNMEVGVLRAGFVRLLRYFFSDSQLNLLNTHSTKEIQQIIQDSLKEKDTMEIFGNIDALSPQDTPTDPVSPTPGSPSAKVKSNKGPDI